MLLLTSPRLSSAHGLQEVTTKEPKESFLLALGFCLSELAQLLNCEQFPLFINLGKVSSTTHFLPTVSHVLRIEFNAKLNAYYVYTI